MGRKYRGKRRNSSLQAISLFPQCFQKARTETRENQGLFGKGLKTFNQVTPSFESYMDKRLTKHHGKMTESLKIT